jgi:PIN domain nuclease of toxin-antitoxin system
LEYVTKFRFGKEPGFAGIAADLAGTVAAQGSAELALTMRHTNLPMHYEDPVDRFLIAQALVDDRAIVTLYSIFANYEAKTLW